MIFVYLKAAQVRLGLGGILPVKCCRGLDFGAAISRTEMACTHIPDNSYPRETLRLEMNRGDRNQHYLRPKNPFRSQRKDGNRPRLV